jgi:hypothetical protein
MYRTREQSINDLSRVGHRWLDEEVRNPLENRDRVINRKNDNNESGSAIKNDSEEQLVEVVEPSVGKVDNRVDTGEKINIPFNNWLDHDDEAGAKYIELGNKVDGLVPHKSSDTKASWLNDNNYDEKDTINKIDLDTKSYQIDVGCLDVIEDNNVIDREKSREFEENIDAMANNVWL